MRNIFTRDGEIRGAIAFDIETRADSRAMEYIDNYKSFEAPSNYKKQEAIDKYIENQKAKEFAKSALYVPTQRIWVICAEDIMTGKKFQYESKKESEVVNAFYSDLTSTHQGKIIYGFNSRKFDVPVLKAASFRGKISLPSQLYLDSFQSDVLDDFPNKIRLQELAWCTGDSKLMSGGDVANLWLEYTLNNDLKARQDCIDYCQHDVDIIADYVRHLYYKDVL
jgi:predicted PolB exonuclease-like 3'-5' exonuclease